MIMRYHLMSYGDIYQGSAFYIAEEADLKAGDFVEVLRGNTSVETGRIGDIRPAFSSEMGDVLHTIRPLTAEEIRAFKEEQIEANIRPYIEGSTDRVSLLFYALIEDNELLIEYLTDRGTLLAGDFLTAFTDTADCPKRETFLSAIRFSDDKKQKKLLENVTGALEPLGKRITADEALLKMTMKQEGEAFACLLEKAGLSIKDGTALAREAIDRERPALLHKLSEAGLLEHSDIPALITYASERGQAESAAFLMSLKKEESDVFDRWEL